MCYIFWFVSLSIALGFECSGSEGEGTRAEKKLPIKITSLGSRKIKKDLALELYELNAVRPVSKCCVSGYWLKIYFKLTVTRIVRRRDANVYIISRRGEAELKIDAVVSTPCVL